MLGLLAAMAAFSGQAQETSGEPTESSPIRNPDLRFAMPQGENGPLSLQTALRHETRYPPAYLRILELIDILPAQLRADIARDPNGFNVRSKTLIEQVRAFCV